MSRELKEKQVGFVGYDAAARTLGYPEIDYS
jgi:hypothetical protein